MALGKNFVNYAECLNLVHAAGLRQIDTNLVQKPTEDNGYTAIVKAYVELQDGTNATGWGDASPLEEYDKDGNPPKPNKAGPVTTATIRMAETRAKARAMRDVVNLGRAVDETEGESSGDAPASAPRDRTPRKATQEQIKEIEGFAKNLGGEDGVKKMEQYISKPLSDLSYEEAKQHIRRLTHQKNNLHKESVDGDNVENTSTYTREDNPQTVEAEIKPESRA